MTGPVRDDRVKTALLVVGAAVLSTAWIAFCGYQWNWGPFASLHKIQTAHLPGNDAQYAPQESPTPPDSPLAGRRVLFLGSSVTFGEAANGVSFAECIAARTGCIMLKEAVSGTTLVDDSPDSYVSRLRGREEETVDLLVCQLSTNDAGQKKPLGAVTPAQVRSGFDTHTVAGALEFIISHARERWGCPVMLYTNARVIITLNTISPRTQSHPV